MGTSNSTSYEHKFLDEPPDDLKCLICLDVAQDPWQHGKGGCGKLFCRQCLDKYGNKPCPNCRMENPDYFEDSKSKREIKLLKVRCDSTNKGCEWVGTLGALADHTSKCDFTLIPCPKGCMDANNGKELIMKMDLDQHLHEECPCRSYKCEHCGEEGTYINITTVHDNKCELKMIPCTNSGCTVQIQRGKMYDHVQFECEHTVIACKYESIGCKKRLKKIEMAEHEDNSYLHLDMAIETISLLKEQSSMRLVNGEYTTTFKLQGYEDKKKANAVHHFPSFYTGCNGYHTEIAVHANGNGDGRGTHISIFAHILEGRHDKQLKWPFVAAVKITLLNQHVDNYHHVKRAEFKLSDNKKVGDARGWQTFIQQSRLGEQYLKNDNLYFKFSVKLADCKPWLE